ncbi:hypothetical protein HBH70_081440 [Parastagonospora nodorum]|nr:hypothetical protein HBH70_081440 [Parastagonospora nodorum]
MLAPTVILSALISSSIAALLPSAVEPASDALITPGPQIELVRRQNDQRYMGWVADEAGAWSTEICDLGNKYYQDASRWGCCATTRSDCGANLAVGCVNGNMIYRATASGSESLSNSLITLVCTSIWTASTDRSFSLCNTAYMFENERDSNSKVNIVCGVSSLDWTYYRTAPVAATETTSSTRTRSASFSLPGRASLIPTSVPTLSPESDPVGGSSSSFGTRRKSKSKAWIAGAVVGPILGLAIIGLLACFFIRRKKNKSRNLTVAPATGGMPPPGATAYQQNTYPTNNPAQPPQYYPDMQQNAAAAPLGVGKQDGYYGPGANPQSPVTSQGSQSPYGAAPQQWQQPGAQPVYGAPSPSISPAPQNVQPAQYMASEGRPFSSELEGNHAYGQPQIVNVQPPKQN